MEPLPLDPSQLPHDPTAIALLIVLGLVQLATLVYTRRTANSLRPPRWRRARRAPRVLRALHRRLTRRDDTPVD